MIKKWLVISLSLMTFAIAICTQGLGFQGSLIAREKIRPLFLLSDNPTKPDDIALATGITYTAEPAYTNPPDTNGRRLIDRDSPYGDWNNTVGINWQDQTVTFDLKHSYELDKIVVEMRPEAIPASITVSISVDGKNNWSQPISSGKEKAQGANWTINLSEQLPKGRYVRLQFKLDQWGWYVREVKIYGRPPATQASAALQQDRDWVLVDAQGQARATIVIADNPSQDIIEAAGFLQQILYKMTGTALPIDWESDYDGTSTALLVGSSRLAKSKGVNVVQYRLAKDQYILRSGDKWLAMVGNDDGELTGTAYAVFDLLQRLGAGWYAPQMLWHVIPQKGLPLVINPINIKEKAAFAMRQVEALSRSEPAWAKPVKYAQRFGGYRVARGDHLLDAWVPPNKVRSTYPEWYPQDAGQPDICNPEVVEYVAKQMSKQMDEQRSASTVAFNIGQNDTDKWVSTEYTAKCGNNPSAHMMWFANALARSLRKTHPGRFSLSFPAYWIAIAPPSPAMKAEPEVNVFFVNQGDRTMPMNVTGDLINATAANQLQQWAATGAKLGIWEWWIPCYGNANWQVMPWYSGDVTMANLRYWKDVGVRFIHYQTEPCEANFWTRQWLQNYVALRGAWNPDRNADEIADEALVKLYGEAAPAMQDFYQVLEESMPKGGGNSWDLPKPEQVYTKSRGEMAMDALKRAMTMTTAPDILARIEAETTMWKTAQEKLNTLR